MMSRSECQGDGRRGDGDEGEGREREDEKGEGRKRKNGDDVGDGEGGLKLLAAESC